MTSAPTHVPEATAPITQQLPTANPTMQYSPVVQHWFYCKVMSGQSTWFPFSHKDSMYLEEAFLNGKSSLMPHVPFVLNEYSLLINPANCCRPNYVVKG